MRHLLAIIGQPGAGKTTALRSALRGVPCQAVEDSAPPFIVYPGGAQLGIDRPGDFGGTDAYPLNVQPQAIAWLRDSPFTAVVTEGDRLSNDGMFQAALNFGYELAIAWIDTPDDLAALRRERRARRDRRTGRAHLQDPAWVLGRQTKILHLVKRWSRYVTRVDGQAEAEHVAADLERLFVIKQLRGISSIDDMSCRRCR